MKESSFIDRIKVFLKSVDGLFFWKEHGGVYGTSGLSDISVCCRGRFVALEVKTETGKTTVLQEITLRRIRAAGGIAEVVRAVEDVRAIISKLV